MANEFEDGILVGLLVGEGHFGGDGRQPQVTLRMHERHEALFRWLERTYPGGRLYGPYDHGGRRYYQWMARGAYLREELVPMLRRTLGPTLDRYAHARFQTMCERYARHLSLASGPSHGVAVVTPVGDPPANTEEGGGQPRGRGETPEGGPELETPQSRALRIFAALRDGDALPEASTSG